MIKKVAEKNHWIGRWYGDIRENSCHQDITINLVYQQLIYGIRSEMGTGIRNTRETVQTPIDLLECPMISVRDGEEGLILRRHSKDNAIQMADADQH